ncbi:hypothetical protein Prudu_017877, partial [Prunus dulcis]
FEKTSRAATFQATPTPPRATPTLRTGPSSTGQLPPSTPARPPPCCCVEPPETAGKRSSFGRFFNLSFSLIRPPNQSCEAPGVQLTHRRDLRRVQLARTSCRRRRKETTRAIILAPAPPPKRRISLWKTLGYSQNTGEVPPNFRQRSEENFKRIEKGKGKKVIRARHSPGVGHAQDLTRIPKRKLGRVLSIDLLRITVILNEPLVLLICL